MSENLLQLEITSKITPLKETSEWQTKIDKFFQAMEYLHSTDLAQSHINKLLNVGVNSLSQTAEFIQQSTQTTMHMINVVLKEITDKLNNVAMHISKFDNELSQKQGLFSKKKVDFFVFFQEQQSTFQSSIETLVFELNTLAQCNQTLDTLIQHLFQCYALLDRDILFLKKVITHFNHADTEIAVVFKSIEFDVSKIYSDLMTQQQLLTQKYASLQVLKNNVLVFTHNIQYITQVSNGCLHNLIDQAQLAKMNHNENQLTLTQQFIHKLNNTFSTIVSSPYTTQV